MCQSGGGTSAPPERAPRPHTHAGIQRDNWQDGWIRFRGNKTRKIREIPVHPELERRRGLIMAHEKTYATSLQQGKERLQKRLGFPFVAHQLRKTFSTYLRDQGVSDLCRRDLLGHTLGLDGVYTQVSRREKQEAIASLDYGVTTPPAKKPKPRTPKPQARRLTVVPSTEEPDRGSIDPLVALELSLGEGHRAVRAKGLVRETWYVFDLDCFTWHLAAGDGLTIATKCGHPVRGVTDETAAHLMAERLRNGVSMTYCLCLDPHNLPEKAPPRRIARLIDQMGA